MGNDRPVRITVGDDTDLAVAEGTRVSEIVAGAFALGVDLDARPWCGETRLESTHPAGLWPLLTGAHLMSAPGLPCAPARGYSLVAIAGPDTGARTVIGDTAVTIGRGAGATLRVRDPSVSTRHVAVTPGQRPIARDLGSTNGTVRWRGPASRLIGRSIALDHGDILSLGSSLVAVVDANQGRTEVIAAAAAHTPRVGPIVGSAVSGIAFAVVTGRWYMALVGLAVPAILAWPTLVERWRTRRPPPDLAPLPHLAAHSQEWPGLPPKHVAIIGSPEHALGTARALALATGRRLRWSNDDEPWMRWLPPADHRDPEIQMVGRGDIPLWCDATIEASPHRLTLHHGGIVRVTPPMSAEADVAEAYARGLAGSATGGSLPSRVRLADLGSKEPSLLGIPTTARDGPPPLVVSIGQSALGVFDLDLDAHGPHLLIGGTTGSGKSALLETLVLGLAHAHPPRELSIALIDFKGGAGVRACMGLPHVSGILTDLDPYLARRALAALSRELSDRKLALSKAGLSSFGDWAERGDAPPRLLVVVDEYQELVAHDRDAIPHLARLAAQGRSLGLHLVLATQRPSGAVTPDIRANVGTTISLRVASESESHDLIGTAEAFALPRDCPGRAVVATGSTRTTIQVALPSCVPTPAVLPWGHSEDLSGAAEAVAAAITDRWIAEPSAAPLWLEPLPRDIVAESNLDSVAVESPIWLGRADIPEERRQPDVWWDPSSGPIVVAGPPKSGRTSCLRLIASQARRVGLRPVWLPEDPREAARTVHVARGRADILLVIDDAQRAWASLADVDRGAAADGLIAYLTDGAPVAVALPLVGHHKIASSATTRVILAGGDANDDAAWLVPRSLHGAAASPGRARIGTPAGWVEAQLGRLPTAAQQANAPLVNPLPHSLSIDELARVAPDTRGSALSGLVAIGLAGDDALPLWIHGGTVAVIGSPGPDRDSIVSAVDEAARQARVPLSVHVLESAMAGVRSDQRDGSMPTIIVTEPHARVVRDVYRGDLDGLIDPRPPRGRVVVVAGGTAVAAQIALA